MAKNKQDATLINNTARKKDIAALAKRVYVLESENVKQWEVIFAIGAVVKPLMLKRKK